MNWLISIFISFVGLFSLWINTLFVAPFRDPNMLWILVPVWLSWFFSEFFQEKEGTSLGNAVSNSVIIIWASIDCARQTLLLISEGTLSYLPDIIIRYLLLSVLFIYGTVIMILGWRGNPIIKYIGRIREITYVFVIFVPVFYNELPLTANHVIAGIIFFPLFYGVIELIDRFTPDPRAVKIDVEDAKNFVPFRNKNKAKPSPTPQSPAGPTIQNQAKIPVSQNPYYNTKKTTSYWNFKL